MFGRIVVGTDGSETAQAAVAVAAELARVDGATLHVVNAYRSPSTSVAVAQAGATATVASDAAYHASSEDMLKDAVRGIEGVEVQTHARSGPPADVVVDLAAELGAGLIVVGSKGMQGARRIIGSVPNSIAHRAGCNVLIAKTA